MASGSSDFSGCTVTLRPRTAATLSSMAVVPSLPCSIRAMVGRETPARRPNSICDQPRAVRAVLIAAPKAVAVLGDSGDAKGSFMAGRWQEVGDRCHGGTDREVRPL